MSEGPRTVCYHLWRGHCAAICPPCLAFYGPVVSDPEPDREGIAT